MPPPHPLPPPPAPSVGVAARLRASFSQSRQTLRLVWRSSPGGTAALGALTVLAAALPPGVVYVGKLIIDAVMGAHAAVGGSALLERALGLVRQLVGSRLGIDVNVAILEKALQLDLRHFEDPEFYDKLTRARREA